MLVSGNVVANNAEAVLQLAVAGVGITRLTDVIVGDAIRNGLLVPILTDWHHVEPVPLFATYPSGRNLSPKLRAMVDFLVEFFGDASRERPGRLTAWRAPRAVDRAAVQPFASAIASRLCRSTSGSSSSVASRPSRTTTRPLTTV